MRKMMSLDLPKIMESLFLTVVTQRVGTVDSVTRVSQLGRFWGVLENIKFRGRKGWLDKEGPLLVSYPLLPLTCLLSLFLHV